MQNIEMGAAPLSRPHTTANEIKGSTYIGAASQNILV